LRLIEIAAWGRGERYQEKAFSEGIQKKENLRKRRKFFKFTVLEIQGRGWSRIVDL
jgi:transketolase N-terminal domain/subunit